MNNTFDSAAASYDQDFTNSPIGKIQRKQVLDFLDSSIPSNPINVLEVNCGTGEDAIWLAKKGHTVVCTDLSNEMLKEVESKVERENLENKINVQQLDLKSIHSDSVKGEFDLIFSNFAGLNCLDPKELSKALEVLSSFLKPNGKLILVFLGKFCAWETKYFLMKGQWKKAFRRFTKEAVVADVNGEKVKTWYYSIAEIKELTKSTLAVTKRKAIGTFVPPSYLNPWFKNKLWLLNIFAFLDNIYGTMGIFTSLSDHYLIELEKA